MMRARILWGTTLLSLSLLLGASIASPWWHVHQMRQAAQARDAAALSEYVDWEQLRANLKFGVQHRLAHQSVNARGEPSKAASLGAAVAAALLGPLVDQLITPQSLARILQGQPPETAAIPALDLGKTSQTAGQPNIRMAYVGLNRFVCSIQSAGHEEEPVHLVLHRQGLLSWKLAELSLPG